MLQRWLSVALLSGLMAAGLTGQLSWDAAGSPRGTVCSPGTTLGDGRLRPFDLHYIVLVDREDLPTATRRNQIPTATSHHHSPITGQWIDGDQWFIDETELINRSFMTETGQRVCEGRDCLRFNYAGHTFLEDIDPDACPELYGLVHPDEPAETVTPDGFADRLRAAIDACQEPTIMKPGTINVFIFDSAGWDETTGTVDRRRNISFGLEHGKWPAVFLDYTRVFQADRAKARAAEEHELAHVFGLRHTCDPAATSRTINNPMQRDCGVHGGRNRTGGFSRSTYDAEGRPGVDQVEIMVKGARRLQRRWLGC